MADDFREITYVTGGSSEGKKIYTFLKYGKGYSTKLIRSLKTHDCGIMLNGKSAKTTELLREGDRLTVRIPYEESETEPLEAPLDIIYEDEDILVINKSPYMAMHPTHNHQGDTLANAVAFYLSQKGRPCVFRAVGRLDKGTSGIVVCALNSLAACKLSGQTHKEYIAAVKGDMPVSGTVTVPIYRPDPMKTLRACSEELGTEPAVTHWEKIAGNGRASLIRLRLETGRTHQIRVHMAYLGHPLAGDDMYGDFMPEEGHQMLHCVSCRLTHPVTDEEMTFTAPLPARFEEITG